MVASAAFSSKLISQTVWNIQEAKAIMLDEATAKLCVAGVCALSKLSVNVTE